MSDKRPVYTHILGLQVFAQPLEKVEGHDELGVREGSAVKVGYLAELVVPVGRDEHEAKRWFAIDQAERQYGPHLSKVKAIADLLDNLGMYEAKATDTIGGLFDE